MKGARKWRRRKRIVEQGKAQLEIENKRREKHKTVLFDINFKKEWDEKQKELNNRKL